MNTIVETVNVTRAVAWLPWAVQYFFLIGLSYGAYLLSLPGVAFRRPGWQVPSRLALLAALVCGLCAPVALLSDLHQPGRFWHFYAYFTPSSWMSWGSFFIPVYLTGLLLYAWLAFRPLLQQHADAQGRFAWAARWLAVGGHESRGPLLMAALLTLVGAVLVAVYTGAEVMAVRARPLWHTPLLPVQFFLTAVAGALGLVMLLNRFGPSRHDAALNRRMAWGVAWLLLASLGVGLVWLVLGMTGLSANDAEALREVGPSQNWQTVAIWAVGATGLAWWLGWKHPDASLLIGLLALHSAWMVRWAIFIGGQEVPKTGAGYYSYQLPLGPDGLLGIVGTAGLWVFIFIVVTNVLPLDRVGRATPGQA